MTENKTTIKDRGIALTLSVLMVLSVVAAGAAAIAPAAAQQVDSVDRTTEATEVQAGQTVNITVDVTLQQADSFEIRENVSEFESASIVDSDGASLSGVQGDTLLANYGGPGASDRSEVSLVYEVTIPSDASPGDTFTLTSAEQSDVDAGSTTLVVPDEGGDQGTRTAPSGAEAGETFNVTVDVSLDQAQSFEIREDVSEFESASIVDSDGASLSGVQGDTLLANYGGPGASDRSEVSLVYEVTIPSDASDGDVFTLTSSDQSDIDLGSDTVTVGAETADPANFDVSNLSPQDATVDVGQEFDVSATVSNTGGEAGEQDVELRLEPNGDAVANETVPLDAGNETTVTFEDVSVDTAGTYNHTIASEDDSESGTLTVEESTASGSVTFGDQATFSTTFTQDSLSTPAVAVNATADTESAVVVTYGSDLTIAGLDTFSASELDGESDVIIPINETGGFAGEHTAHVIPTSELSGSYEAGDTVSSETADAVLDSDTATVHQSFVDFQDQSFSGATEEIQVDSTLSPADGDAVYAVYVHEKTDTGGVGSIVGSTDVLASGTNEDAMVSLQNSLDPGTDAEYIAMVHLVDDSLSDGDDAPPAGETDILSHTSTSGAVPGGVTDDATITVEQSAATFEVSGLEADNLNFTSNAGTSAVAGTDMLEITATVTNADDFEDTQTVEFQFGGSVAASEEVNLAGGDSTTVTFTVTAPDVDAGNYTHGVFTNDDSQTAEIELLPAVSLLDSPARDTTGDGLLNDVNGDGTFNIVDVSAFLNNRDSVTEEASEYFDYNGDDTINIVDVSRLLNILNE